MPGTFSNDFFQIENAEVTTDYSLIGSLKTSRALNDDYKIEGTNGMTFGVSSGTGEGTCQILAICAASLDFSTGGDHFFQWIKGFAWPSSATQREGGGRISISSDAPPTAVRSVLLATVVPTGGSGYTMGDELSLVGGTTTETAVVIVTGLTGSSVTTVSPKATSRGAYTVLPSNPISTTGGTGTGCTLNIAGTGNPPTGWIYTVTNSKEWFVAGSDTVIVDGWVCYVVDPNGTPDLESGSCVMTSIDRMGVGITMIAVSKVATHVMDVSRYGKGIAVKDGTAGSPVTMADFLAYDNDNSRALGVVTRQSGIFFLAGKLTIGSVGQTAVTVFKETSKVLVYQGFPVATTFYEIILLGASGFVTTFQFGTYSGGVASGGVTIRGADRYTHYAGVATTPVPAIWSIDADALNTLCLLYGCNFSQMRVAAFKSDSEIKFCTFQDFGDITAGGATFDNCTFLDLRKTAPISATYAVKVQTSTATVTNCEFVNCATALLWDRNADTSGKLNGSSFTSGGTGHAIEFGTNTPGNPSTLAFTNVTFTGYGADGTTDAAIYNNSGKAITINVSGGTTPTVRNGTGASTTVNTSVTLKVTCKTEAGAAIQSVQVAVYKVSDGTQLMNEATTAQGVAEEIVSVVAGTAVRIEARKAAGGANDYLPVSSPQTTTSTGLDVTITMIEDPTNEL